MLPDFIQPTPNPTVVRYAIHRYLCWCMSLDSLCVIYFVIISSNTQDHGVEESIFQDPAKLHLTIGTLALLNDTEVRRASEHLQECLNTIR